MEFYVVEGRDTDDSFGAVYDAFYPIAYFRSKEAAERFASEQPTFIKDDEEVGISGPYEYRIRTRKFDD